MKNNIFNPIGNQKLKINKKMKKLIIPIHTQTHIKRFLITIFISAHLFGYSQNYDGTCPEGETSYTDCDCAPSGMTNFEAIHIKDTSDYTYLIHIDPTANDSNEDGSAAHPYNSWFDITWKSNTAYVQKRGTTFSTAQTIVAGASNTMLGAYGIGDKPVIENTTTANNTMNIQSPYVLIRDISLQAPNMKSGVILFLRGTSDHVIVFQCDICNGGWEGILSYAEYGHIIGCNIYNIGQDAIWLSQTPYFEIAYNNIYKLNQIWFPGAGVNISGGDGIQVENDFEQIWIHHNIIDHGDTGNKACILLSSSSDYNYTCNRAIIEFNTLVGLKTTQYGGCNVNLDGGSNHTIRYNKFYAAEIIEDSYPDSLSLGLYIASNHDSVYGNVFVDFDEAIHSSTNSQTVISNNTFYNTQEYIIKGSNGHFKFYNNIFDQKLFSGLTIDEEKNNLFVTGTPWPKSFNGNPEYIDPENNDFRLLETSDAINKGTDLEYYYYDIDMKEITDINDIGAYEYKLSPETSIQYLKKNTKDQCIVIPNPATSVIWITGYVGIEELRIYDMIGNEVLYKENLVENTKIRVDYFKKGLFMVVIKTKTNIHISKFIKS